MRCQLVLFHQPRLNSSSSSWRDKRDQNKCCRRETECVSASLYEQNHSGSFRVNITLARLPESEMHLLQDYTETFHPKIMNKSLPAMLCFLLSSLAVIIQLCFVFPPLFAKVIHAYKNVNITKICITIPPEIVSDNLWYIFLQMFFYEYVNIKNIFKWNCRIDAIFAICFFFSLNISGTSFCVRIYRSISFYLLAAKFFKLWICHHLFKYFHVDRYRVFPFSYVQTKLQWTSPYT